MLASLKDGYGRETFDYNVKALIEEGKSKKQALAISYTRARHCYVKKFPSGMLPKWLGFKV